MKEVEIKQGETPPWMRRLLGRAIVWLYTTQSGVQMQPPGESCATISMLLISVLRHCGIKARLAVGAAKWDGYPIGYKWNGVHEYHAWVFTEYREVVDLACGMLNTRSDLTREVRLIQPPKNCWTRSEYLADREYVEIEDGHAHLNVDVPGEQSYDLLLSLLLDFCERNKQAFEKEGVASP